MSATAGDAVAAILQLIAQALAHVPGAVSGNVAPGTWDPTTGTIKALIGTTGTLGDGTDPDAQILWPEPIPVLTHHLGAQGGPIGMERLILLPYEGGYVALYHTDSDDSPNVPAGEHHTYLRSADRGNILDSFLKVQTDATRVGHEQKVSVLAPVVVLGADQKSDDLALVRLSDLQNAVNAVIQSVQTALDQLAVKVQSGTGVPSPTIAAVTPTASEISYSA